MTKLIIRDAQGRVETELYGTRYEACEELNFREIEAPEYTYEIG